MPRGVRKVVGAGAIVAQVQTIGKSLGELLKLLEKEGSTIGADQFEKVFGFLRATLAKVEEQARKDRVVISAGEFSWDAPVTNGQPVMSAGTMVAQPSYGRPAAIARVDTTVASAKPTQTLEAAKAEWKKPAGRIAKSSPNLELAGTVTHQEITTEKLMVNRLDDATKVGFLDEKDQKGDLE